MLHQNCIFGKVRHSVTRERVSSSAKSAGLELVEMGPEWCILKGRGRATVKAAVPRLLNTMLFSDCRFSGTAFVGNG